MRGLVVLAALAGTGQAPAADPAHVPAVKIPGVGPEDTRVEVDVTKPPWRAIGRVQTELGGRCTGFLIGASRVLTAAHCLYTMHARHFLQPGSIHFVTGYDHGAFTGHARAVSFRVGPGFDPLNEGRSAGADWALLTLDTPLGADGRFFGLLSSAPAVGEAVVLAGYGQDREEVMQADLSCNVAGWTGDGGDRDLMRHDCSGTRGTSGAPVLMHTRAGWIVVGLEIAEEMGRPDGLAVPAFAIRSAIGSP